MLTDPLHPAVVHFPIVLALLLPVVTAVALWVVLRGRALTRPVWSVVVAFSVLTAASAWVAVRTGEDQEERVEDVVSDDAIHEHEEAAEFFLPLAAVVMLVSAAGLLKGRPGDAARWLTLVGALGAAAAIVRVGATGGELVYRHGAAAAYLQQPAGVGDAHDDDTGEEHMDEAEGERPEGGGEAVHEDAGQGR